MAEVLGLASSIIAIIQIVAKITQLAYQYTTDVRGAPESIGTFLEEIRSLTYILNTLNEYRKKNPHLGAIQKLERPLNEYLAEMNMLATKLESKINPSWWRRTITKLKWPLNDGEMSEYLARIERFKSMIMIAVGTANLSQQVAVRGAEWGIGKRQGMHYLMGGPENNNFIEEMPPTDERRNLVLNWLYPHSPDQKHAEIVKRRQMDTSQLMLETPQFKNWSASDADSRTLLVLGVAGAGKTFMTSFMIDYLSRQASQGVCGVAYVYFDYKDPDLQKPTSILASLGKQLASQTKQALPKELGCIYDELSYQQRRPSTEQLYQILLRLTKHFDKTFIVCDSFDEYQGQQKELLPLFRRMEGNGIWLLLTSRENCVDVKEFFQNSTKVRFCATSEVIENYIERRITSFIPGEDRGRIVSELTDCAKRIFLLAFSNTKYLCEQMERKRDLGQLRTSKADSATSYSSLTYNHSGYPFELLEQLKVPKGPASNPDSPLDNTYNCYMTAFHERRESVELGLIVLLWLVKTRRTLKVPELQLAVSMHTGKRKGKNLHEVYLPDRKVILDVCANFVLFDEEDDTIKLIHYTAQEFLLKNLIIPSDADLKVALACIYYLSLGIFAQGACTTNSSLETRQKQHPFHKYASENLSYHLRSCNEASTENAVFNFLKEPGCVKSYLQALHCKAPPSSTGKEPEYHDQYPKQQTSLHIAATLGHLTVAQKLLRRGARINALDDYGRTPILIAAMEGHERIVNLLLQKGADPSIPDKNGITPLHVSICQEHGAESMLKLLLARGVKLSTMDHRGCTPLHWAASQGLEPETRILLKLGANTSSTDMEGWTALHHAAKNGYEPLVRTLLEWGASPSSIDKDGKTALHLAVSYKPILELLLKKGANITSVDSRGRTVLHWACYLGGLDVVNSLLKSNADHSYVDDEGRTALHYAAFEGHKSIVELLREVGADLSAEDNRGQTAYQVAVARSHASIVQLLNAP